MCSQLAVAVSSRYDFTPLSDGIKVKRRDNEEEFTLNTSGLPKCTCRYFIDTQLPCQHIFAFLIHSGENLFNEFLIPDKYKIFGKCETLASLIENVNHGGDADVAVATRRLERVNQVQGVLGEILSECHGSLSIEGISTAVTQLTHVLAGLKVGIRKTSRIFG